ncbi:MAG: RNA-binding protein [Desulfomonile tiedjei]|nr:RNA-binding protein [Desulfomonile tiedjei]
MNGINIYVGNLSFEANEEQLKELFEGYGPVTSAKIISDHATGRSRGFGFVEMADRDEGLRAIEELDSKDFHGRTLRINEARPKTGPGGGQQDGGPGRSRW